MRQSARLNPNVTIEQVDTPSTPNSNRIPCTSPNIISQEAVNYITKQVWDSPHDHWTPADILEASPTLRATGNAMHDVDIEHFCAAVVHPDTGETVTKY